MNILQYESLQEQKSHGAEEFPYTTYICSIPQDFSEVPIHWHDEMEFIYIKKGRGVVSVDLKPQIVAAGTIALILPGQLHAIRQLEGERMEYENIIFHPSLLISRQTDLCASHFLTPLLTRELAVPTFFTPEAEGYVELAASLDQADEVCKSFPQAYPFAIKSQLFGFFFQLFTRYGVKKKAPGADPSLTRIKQVVKFIEENYSNPIRIEDIARELGMSQSHFMKFFRHAMGTTFVAYLNEYRLTMASRMLVASTDSILSIASETGFDSLSNFNRQFKKRFGVTPRDYRGGKWNVLG